MAVDSLVETILSGVLTGSATAGASVLGFFREMKKRLADLETKVGSFEDRKGLVYSVHLMDESVKTLEDGLKKFKREVDNWDEHPPEWVQLLRRRTTSSVDLIEHQDFERGFNGFNGRLRDFDERLRRYEDDLGKIARKLSLLEEQLRDSDANRSREISAVREGIASINGLMRGLQSIIETGPTRK